MRVREGGRNEGEGGRNEGEGSASCSRAGSDVLM